MPGSSWSRRDHNRASKCSSLSLLDQSSNTKKFATEDLTADDGAMETCGRGNGGRGDKGRLWLECLPVEAGMGQRWRCRQHLGSIWQVVSWHAICGWMLADPWQGLINSIIVICPLMCWSCQPGVVVSRNGTSKLGGIGDGQKHDGRK